MVRVASPCTPCLRHYLTAAIHMTRPKLLHYCIWFNNREWSFNNRERSFIYFVFDTSSPVYPNGKKSVSSAHANNIYGLARYHEYGLVFTISEISPTEMHYKRGASLYTCRTNSLFVRFLMLIMRFNALFRSVVILNHASRFMQPRILPPSSDKSTRPTLRQQRYSTTQEGWRRRRGRRRGPWVAICSSIICLRSSVTPNSPRCLCRLVLWYRLTSTWTEPPVRASASVGADNYLYAR